MRIACRQALLTRSDLDTHFEAALDGNAVA
jgi:hypothetical protein